MKTVQIIPILGSDLSLCCKYWKGEGRRGPIPDTLYLSLLTVIIVSNAFMSWQKIFREELSLLTSYNWQSVKDLGSNETDCIFPGPGASSKMGIKSVPLLMKWSVICLRNFITRVWFLLTSWLCSSGAPCFGVKVSECFPDCVIISDNSPQCNDTPSQPAFLQCNGRRPCWLQWHKTLSWIVTKHSRYRNFLISGVMKTLYK